MRTKSALIIGVDGLVGGGLHRLFKRNGIRVHGSTRRRPVRSSDIFLDLADPNLGTAKLPQADVAIICAAANGFAYCRSNPANAMQINVEGPRILARRFAARGTRVIYLSSSAVFDFSRPHVAALAGRCPTTVYGASKAAGEENVLAVGEMATVVRLTKVLTPTMTLLRQWVGALRAGRRVVAFSDLYFCPISLDYAANALLAITEANASGIFNVSGAEDISYFRAASHFAMRMGLDEFKVIDGRAASKGIPREEIASFTSLDASRYTALAGELPPQPLDVLDAVYEPAIASAVSLL